MLPLILYLRKRKKTDRSVIPSHQPVQKPCKPFFIVKLHSVRVTDITSEVVDDDIPFHNLDDHTESCKEASDEIKCEVQEPIGDSFTKEMQLPMRDSFTDENSDSCPGVTSNHSLKQEVTAQQGAMEKNPHRLKGHDINIISEPFSNDQNDLKEKVIMHDNCQGIDSINDTEEISSNSLNNEGIVQNNTATELSDPCGQAESTLADEARGEITKDMPVISENTENTEGPLSCDKKEEETLKLVVKNQNKSQGIERRGERHSSSDIDFGYGTLSSSVLDSADTTTKSPCHLEIGKSHMSCDQGIDAPEMTSLSLPKPDPEVNTTDCVDMLHKKPLSAEPETLSILDQYILSNGHKFH